MKIALVGWGSLIWNHGVLQTSGEWMNNGPLLPIEFARIASDGRMTLVIYPPAPTVPTLWIRAGSHDLDQVIENLGERERTTANNVGFLCRATGRRRARFPRLIKTFQRWSFQNSLDAVVWTDLESTFERETGVPFTHQSAINYLSELRGAKRDSAEEYIRSAPPQTDTPLRRRIERELGWVAVD